MTGFGFIHDKLEIKFLILYIAARVIEPVPFDTMLDLTLCDDAIDYFDFSDCLADLVRTEHLTLSRDGVYQITEKGRRNSEICGKAAQWDVYRKAVSGGRYGQRDGFAADGHTPGHGGGALRPLSARAGTSV